MNNLAKKKTIIVLFFLFVETISCSAYACKDVAKYMKVYVQHPDNVGSSWRLYVRPRNGVCLDPNASYIQRDIGMTGDSVIQPGTKNCEDSYKSFFPIRAPYMQGYSGPTTEVSIFYWGKGLPGLYEVEITWERHWNPESVSVVSACIK